jgi:putative flippase GtrA
MRPPALRIMVSMAEENGATQTPQRGARVLRFIAAGIGNTLISLVIYQSALFVMKHQPAYALAYAAGIAIAYYLYARHVFDAQTSTRGFMIFAAFYAAAGLAGSVINSALIDTLGWHARLAIFVTVLLMLPINYLGSRWCLRGAANKKIAEPM